MDIIHNHHSLKYRFNRLVIILFLCTGLVAFIFFSWMLNRVTQNLGEHLVSEYILHQKSLLFSLLNREMALVTKMVTSTSLQAWALQEDDANLKRLAMETLDRYRQVFADRSFFLPLMPLNTSTITMLTIAIKDRS